MPRPAAVRRLLLVAAILGLGGCGDDGPAAPPGPLVPLVPLVPPAALAPRAALPPPVVAAQPTAAELADLALPPEVVAGAVLRTFVSPAGVALKQVTIEVLTDGAVTGQMGALGGSDPTTSVLVAVAVQGDGCPMRVRLAHPTRVDRAEHRPTVPTGLQWTPAAVQTDPLPIAPGRLTVLTGTAPAGAPPRTCRVDLVLE